MAALYGLGLVVAAAGSWLIWDRHRYRGAPGDAASFRPTAEVFRDPATGRMTRVYEDPRTGRRQYRDEPEAASDAE